MGGWWTWALVSPDGVAPSRMVSVSASINLPLHHKVQKFSSGTGSATVAAPFHGGAGYIVQCHLGRGLPPKWHLIHVS